MGPRVLPPTTSGRFFLKIQILFEHRCFFSVEFPPRFLKLMMFNKFHPAKFHDDFNFMFL